jgi:hypothetical protein
MTVATVTIGFDVIQDEVRHLVQEGIICRCDPIYKLCNCFPAREWPAVEQELQKRDFLLRDHVIDLLGPETWSDD